MCIATLVLVAIVIMGVYVDTICNVGGDLMIIACKLCENFHTVVKNTIKYALRLILMTFNVSIFVYFRNFKVFRFISTRI